MTDLLITNAALLDVETGTLHDGSSLRIAGDRVSEIALGRRLDRVAGDHVVDADGKTLMPGLIDAHVHASVTTLDLAALARRPATRVGIETKAALEGMVGEASPPCGTPADWTEESPKRSTWGSSAARGSSVRAGC